MKRSNGFTLVELIVATAVLGILAGIAVPRFMNAAISARGATIVADMHACEAAINIYYSRNSIFPDDINSLLGTHISVWPEPPLGKALIKKNNGSDLEIDNQATSYVYIKPATGSELDIRVGRITLGGMTIDEILSAPGESLTLTDVD